MNTVRLLGWEHWSWCDLGKKAFIDHGHLTGALKGACELSGEYPFPWYTHKSPEAPSQNPGLIICVSQHSRVKQQRASL